MYLKSSAAQDIGFDENKKCLHPERPGSELTFRVNPTSQKVLMTIVKNDGNWGVKDLFLDKCTVV
jgi:hypothetical protein